MWGYALKDGEAPTNPSRSKKLRHVGDLTGVCWYGDNQAMTHQLMKGLPSLCPAVVMCRCRMCV